MKKDIDIRLVGSQLGMDPRHLEYELSRILSPAPDIAAARIRIQKPYSPPYILLKSSPQAHLSHIDQFHEGFGKS